jgi:hypothetical protein
MPHETGPIHTKGSVMGRRERDRPRIKVTINASDEDIANLIAHLLLLSLSLADVKEVAR